MKDRIAKANEAFGLTVLIILISSFTVLAVNCYYL